MGWGNFFGTIGKIGAGIAAPFTGGASLMAIPAIDALSKGAGSASQSMASNRGTKAEMMMDQNRDLESQLLAREAEKREAQANAYKNAMRSDMAVNWKPTVRPEGIPNISYNAGPSAAGRDIASTMFNQSKSRLGAPDLQNQQGMQAYRNLANDKEFGKTQKSGFWEKLLGIASGVAPIAGAYLGGGGNGLPGYTNKPQ